MNDNNFNDKNLHYMYNLHNNVIRPRADIEDMFTYHTQSSYSLNRRILYGRDYPDSTIDYDLYTFLTFIKHDIDYERTLKIMRFESSVPEGMFEEILIDKEFIKAKETGEKIDVKAEAAKMDATQLSMLLKKHGINVSGKKKKLLKLAVKNIPEHEFGPKDFEIAPKGEEYLEEYKWIGLYKYSLFEFDFNEFYKYLDEHEGNYNELALDFVYEHLKKAIKTENNSYFDRCLQAKTNIYLCDKYDVESGLKSSLERFIYRLNPPFYSYTEMYDTDYIFREELIDEIKEAIEILKKDNVKDEFYAIWDSMTFRKEYIPCSVAYEYLEKIIALENYDEHETLSDEVYTAYFDTVYENYNIALYYYQMEEQEIAIDYLTSVIKSSTNIKPALYCKAYCDYDLSNFEYAHESLDEALKIDENDGRLWSLKGKCYLEEEKRDEALKCFNKSIEVSPDDMIVWIEKGEYHDKVEEYAEALECFSKAYELDDDVLSIYWKIEVYDKLKKREKVDECFEKILKQSGEDLYYLFERGVYCSVVKDYEKALEYFDKCLEINEELSSIWFMEGNIYNKLGDLENTEECVRIVSDIGPSMIPTIKKMMIDKIFKKIE